MSFSTTIAVAFGDTDPAGFVYYPNLFHYCHLAMERFFGEHCGTPYHFLINEQEIGFPTVRVEAEFHEPVIYGDEIEVLIDVVELGKSSVTMRYLLKRRAGAQASATIRMVHVAMKLDSRSPIEIPELLREALRHAKEESSEKS